MFQICCYKILYENECISWFFINVCSSFCWAVQFRVFFEWWDFNRCYLKSTIAKADQGQLERRTKDKKSLKRWALRASRHEYEIRKVFGGKLSIKCIWKIIPIKFTNRLNFDFETWMQWFELAWDRNNEEYASTWKAKIILYFSLFFTFYGTHKHKNDFRIHIVFLLP